jgi:poly(A) polymerase
VQQIHRRSCESRASCEDPVRILRAPKFAGRLDLGITPDVYDVRSRLRREALRSRREALAVG